MMPIHPNFQRKAVKVHMHLQVPQGAVAQISLDAAWIKSVIRTCSRFANWTNRMCLDHNTTRTSARITWDANPT